MTTMEDGKNNNIFYITNKLEMFTAQVEQESRHFNFCATALDDLVETIKQHRKKNSIPGEENYGPQNNLIIINYEFYSTHLKSISEHIFLANFCSASPHFLFLDLNPEMVFNAKNLEFDSDDFHYNVSRREETSGELLLNAFFLSLIFRCIANRKRVQNYIVNTFQTLVESTIVKKQKMQIEKLYAELEAISKIDSLTKVLSRKAFFDAMEQERSRTLRGQRRIEDCTSPVHPCKKPLEEITMHYGHFACLMIDFDDFKQINDVYGHLSGDAVLKKMGELLTSNQIFRESDIIGRYGGEEFVAILPETNARHAFQPAERLREALRKVEFTCDKGTFHVTISIGISEYKPGDTCDHVIHKADIALYHAKALKKDTVIIYNETQHQDAG